MYEKKISYTDYNGNEVKDESLYFNLTSREMTTLMALWNTPDLEQYLMDVAGRQQPNEIFPTLEEFILTAYGVRSSDGKRFDKSPEIRRDFENSIAYAEYFENFFNDPQEVALFIQSVARTSNRSKNQNVGKNLKAVETKPFVTNQQKFEGKTNEEIIAILLEEQNQGGN